MIEAPSLVETRIETGNPEIDRILCGGFPARSINIVMGHPGTGKTMFVERLMFANVREGRPILYLTTLSEPLPKVLRYLQVQGFYDEEQIGTSILYEDIGPFLEKDGIGATITVLKERIREQAPRIIIIDSFKALHELTTSTAELRLMLYQLTGLLSAYDATAFLVGEYQDEHARIWPEFAIADAIVQFLRVDLSSRDERFMRVLKLRGSSYLEGLHAFRITSQGLEVFPRVLTPDIPVTYESLQERVPTGTPGLDSHLQGGFWRGSTVLLLGPSGAGKTTLALQFVLDGARRGEPGVYLSLQEHPIQMANTVRGLSAELSPEALEKVHFLYEAPVELQIDRVVVLLFRLIAEQGIRRVVIDSLAELIHGATDARRLHDYIYSMIQHFTINQVTSLVLVEADTLGIAAGGRYSYLSDVVIQLGMHPGEARERDLAILKARGTAHSLTPVPLLLSAEGAWVGEGG